MFEISHNIGCRSCSQTDGIKHMYSYLDNDNDEFRSKTEFEVMTIIEKWRAQNNLICEFCGSNNVEVFQIEIDNEPLYNQNKIVERCQAEGEFMLQINIEKLNLRIELTPEFSQTLSNNFLNQALFEIYNTIINRPESQFKINQKGFMFVCVTGGTNSIDNQPYKRLETFRSVGLSKEQILKEIRLLINVYEIPIDFQLTLKSSTNFDLNFVLKSYEHSRYENGIRVAEPNKGAGRAVKVEPNISGCDGYNITAGEGYIVTIFNLDGNNLILSNNVQMTPKPMKIISQSSDKVVLRGYRMEAMSPFGWIDFNGEDYGLSIFLINGEIDKCVLHLHDRGVDIEY